MLSLSLVPSHSYFFLFIFPSYLHPFSITRSHRLYLPASSKVSKSRPGQPSHPDVVEVEGTAGELCTQWDDIRKVATKKLESMGVEPPAFQNGVQVFQTRRLWDSARALLPDEELRANLSLTSPPLAPYVRARRCGWRRKLLRSTSWINRASTASTSPRPRTSGAFWRRRPATRRRRTKPWISATAPPPTPRRPPPSRDSLPLPLVRYHLPSTLPSSVVQEFIEI